MQSAFQEKCSYTMAVQGLWTGNGDGASDEGFGGANEMGRGGLSTAVVAAFANSSAASLPGMPL